MNAYHEATAYKVSATTLTLVWAYFWFDLTKLVLDAASAIDYLVSVSPILSTFLEWWRSLWHPLIAAAFEWFGGKRPTPEGLRFLGDFFGIWISVINLAIAVRLLEFYQDRQRQAEDGWVTPEAPEYTNVYRYIGGLLLFAALFLFLGWLEGANEEDIWAAPVGVLVFFGPYYIVHETWGSVVRLWGVDVHLLRWTIGIITVSYGLALAYWLAFG